MSKIFVAGINFGLKTIVLDHHAKTQHIINKLPEIRSQAVKLMGEDVVVIIALHEYALTFKAIPNAQKKECLNQLDTALKTHKNMILIPGSFAAYEKLSTCVNPEDRKHKIVENYIKNLKNPQYSHDKLYAKDFTNTKEKFTSGKSLDNTLWLQNSSYILSSEADSKRIKHKKSYPWKEENKLADGTVDHFFYMGGDSEIKAVTINKEQIDIGLLICREHLLNPSKEITDNPPPIEVIVSASVKKDEKRLFGALNIYMDSVHGLSVSINDKHPRCHEIGEVKAFYYNLTNGNNTEEPVIHFKETIGAAPIKDPNKQTFGFTNGFLLSATKTSTDKKVPAATHVTTISTQKATATTTIQPSGASSTRITLKSNNTLSGLKGGFFNSTTTSDSPSTPKDDKENKGFAGFKKGFLC